jgi:hypothetical protein
LLYNVSHIPFDSSSPLSPPKEFWKKFRRCKEWFAML